MMPAIMMAVPKYSMPCDGDQAVRSSPLTRWLMTSIGAAMRKIPVPHCMIRSDSLSTP